MRTTQKNKTEKMTKKVIVSFPSICRLSPTRVVLTLTTFEREGGET